MSIAILYIIADWIKCRSNSPSSACHIIMYNAVPLINKNSGNKVLSISIDLFFINIESNNKDKTG